MALAHVLSAIRTLVLDAPPLPQNQTDRGEVLRELFPKLSPEEIRDLSSMQPAKLQVYTRSIFNSETDLIFSYHPVVGALLRRSFELQGKSFHGWSFVKQAHLLHPWKTSTTEGLMEAFGRALADPRIDVGPLRKELSEFASFERHLFYARRRPGGNYDPAASMSFQDLAEMTVGEILELQWGVPDTVSLETFSLDVGRVCSHFRREGSTLPEVIEERVARIIFSRDRNHTVRWREVSVPFFDCILSKRQGGGVLAEIAEAVLSEFADDIPEEQGFHSFLETLRFALESGIVVVPRSL